MPKIKIDPPTDKDKLSIIENYLLDKDRKMRKSVNKYETGSSRNILKRSFKFKTFDIVNVSLKRSESGLML